MKLRIGCVYYFYATINGDKMTEILLSWLGSADMRNLETYSPGASPGPLLSVLSEHHYDELHLLIAREREAADKFISSLKKIYPSLKITPHFYLFDDPTDYKNVFISTAKALKAIDPYNRQNGNREITFFITPGTPMMVAVLCMMAERIPGIALLQHSVENGTRYVEWFLPEHKEEYNTVVDNMIGENINDAFCDIKYTSPEMEQVLRNASRCAAYNIRVMLLGESGTGKELIASGIHKASGRQGKFVAINCGAIPANLLDSELFGYKKGAFTGATADYDGKIVQADGGTLFLDEIGELPLEQQVKLLRMLQENEVTPLGSREPRKVDVKIITATHRDLPSMVKHGDFRLDLFYRLAIFVIKIPPLRQRGADILQLAEFCLEKINNIVCNDKKEEYKWFADDVADFLKSQPWHGNFRELENAVFQAHFLSSSKVINATDIRNVLITFPQENSAEFTADGKFNLDNVLKKIEKNYIDQAMDAANNNKSQAAKLLGLSSHQTLTNRMAKIEESLKKEQSRL